MNNDQNLVETHGYLLQLPGESHGPRACGAMIHGSQKDWAQLKWLAQEYDGQNNLQKCVEYEKSWFLSAHKHCVGQWYFCKIPG